MVAKTDKTIVEAVCLVFPMFWFIHLVCTLFYKGMWQHFSQKPSRNILKSGEVSIFAFLRFGLGKVRQRLVVITNKIK